jgi:hypothetical protein
MKIITPNLNYSNRYIRENITRWGVGPNQCTHVVSKKGVTLYLYLDIASGPNFTSQSENIKGIDLPHQCDGIYNWIYFLDLEGNHQIHLCHVVSPTELGTKHIDLLIRANKCLQLLFFSGELQKQKDSYTLNFYSGSTCMSELPDQEIIGNNFIPLFRQVVQLSDKDRVEFKNQPFQGKSRLTDKEVLERYESVGYRLLFFQSRLHCQKYQRYVIRSKSLRKKLTILTNSLDASFARKDQNKIKGIQSQLTNIQDQIRNVPKPYSIGIETF